MPDQSARDARGWRDYRADHADEQLDHVTCQVADLEESGQAWGARLILPARAVGARSGLAEFTAFIEHGELAASARHA